MSLKYKSWDDINLSVYNKIKSIILDKELTDVDKNIEFISLFYDISIEDVYKMKISEIHDMLQKISFINNLPTPRKINLKHIIINNVKYDILTDISKYNVSQYVDFQTLVKKGDEYAATILATILIPHGKNYNEGYDFNSVVNDINEYLPASIAVSLIFFYTKKLMNSIKGTVTYLEAMTMTTPMSKETKPMKKQIMENLNKMKHLFG